MAISESAQSRSPKVPTLGVVFQASGSPFDRCFLAFAW